MDPTTDAVNQQLSNLILVGWILLIPVGVLLAIVLYKLAFLLHMVSEFAGMARYEVFPILKELRDTSANIEVLTKKALTTVETVESGVSAIRPALHSGSNNVKFAAKSVVKSAENGFFGLLSGVKRALKSDP
jgi:hypothetical protein